MTEQALLIVVGILSVMTLLLMCATYYWMLQYFKLRYVSPQTHQIKNICEECKHSEIGNRPERDGKKHNHYRIGDKGQERTNNSIVDKTANEK